MKNKIKGNSLFKEALNAIYANNHEKLQELIGKGFNINEKDRDGRTLLFYAVIDNDETATEFLLKNQTRVNEKDQLGWSPLHYAAQNNAIEIAKLLIDHNGDLEAKDDYGNTALSRAVFSSQGKGDMIRLLLSRGADPNNENNAGVSPLKLAHAIANYDVKCFFY